jgi:ankyrin repeat protein
MLAAQAPIFKVRDLSDEGFTLLEDVVYGNEQTEEPLEEGREFSTGSGGAYPSVIEIVLQASLEHGFFSALWPDKQGQLPLHAAIRSGKTWTEGVKSLVEAYPEALAIPHPSTSLYPFMLAAEDNHDNVEMVYELLRHTPSLMGEIMCNHNSR